MGMFTDALGRAGRLGKNLPEISATYDLTGASRDLGKMLAKDVDLLAYEMDAAIANLHPAVAELIARKADAILDTARMANLQTHEGFGGSVGGSRRLDFEISRAADFLNPDVTSGSRKTWERFISAVDTNKPFITGTVSTVGTSVDLAMIEEESMIFLGFTEKAGMATPTAVQAVINTETQNYQSLNFDMSNVNEQDVMVYELKQDLKVAPEQKIQLNVRYDEVGTDYLTPIVVHFLMATDMRTM